MKCVRFASAALGTLLLLGGYPRQSVAAQPPRYDNRDRDGWDRPPDDYRADIQRRGFQDGLEGARRDFENHRQPNVNNRDEYRHPNNVPGRMRRQYQEAFRRGYDVGVRHMMGGGNDRDRHDDRDRR